MQTKLLLISICLLTAGYTQIKNYHKEKSTQRLTEVSDYSGYKNNPVSDSLIQSKIDSLTGGWENIQPANPANSSQKQYAGKIGNNKAFLNANINTINLREQKILNIYAAIGPQLYDFYFNEEELFGNPKFQRDYSVLDSFYLKNLHRFNYDKKYLKGYYTDKFLQEPKRSLIIRFVDDSTKLEGYLIDNTLSHKPVYFLLNQSKPSMILNYKVVCFHKDTKAVNENKITEVPATVSYSVNLPNENNKDYITFLNKQTGGMIGGWSGNMNSVQYTSYPAAVEKYKKEFEYAENASHIHQSRSMVGGFDNSEVIYNQNDWVVIKQETFIGAIDYYGNLNTSYIVYDIKNKKFLDKDDVLISENSIRHLIDKNIIEAQEYNYAFVCPDGVAFRTEGNHGWMYRFYLMEWKEVLPLLNSKFKKKYAYFWDKEQDNTEVN